MEASISFSPRHVWTANSVRNKNDNDLTKTLILMESQVCVSAKRHCWAHICANVRKSWGHFAAIVAILAGAFCERDFSSECCSWTKEKEDPLPGLDAPSCPREWLDCEFEFVTAATLLPSGAGFRRHFRLVWNSLRSNSSRLHRQHGEAMIGCKENDEEGHIRDDVCIWFAPSQLRLRLWCNRVLLRRGFGPRAITSAAAGSWLWFWSGWYYCWMKQTAVVEALGVAVVAIKLSHRDWSVCCQCLSDVVAGIVAMNLQTRHRSSIIPGMGFLFRSTRLAKHPRSIG